MTELIQCSEAEYFAIPDRFHVSSAGKLLISPAYYNAHKDDDGESSARKLGSITHANKGDPVARAKYVVKPEVDLTGCRDSKGNLSAAPWATSEGKKRVADAEAAFEAAHPGAVLCTADELYRADAMAASLTKAEAALGSALHREVCVLWDDSDGTPCILRADAIFVVDGKVVVVDYKTTGKPLTNHGLQSDFFKWGYQRQAAQYDEGVRAAQVAGLLPLGDVEFQIGWVSSVSPFEAHFQTVPVEVIEAGEADVKEARRRWMNGRATGEWATASELGTLAVTVLLPRWMLAETADSSDVDDLGLEGM